MEIGDVVVCQESGMLHPHQPRQGLVVGFNKQGEGGQDFVHVLIDNEVIMFMHFDLRVINGSR